jgi:Uma2 family endonuclease
MNNWNFLNGMSEPLADIASPQQFPDRTQLPKSDGVFAGNFQEHLQSIIITESIIQTLQDLHPNGQYYIGQDCRIYWDKTEPLEKGAVAPGWFYIPDLSPRLEGKVRRSYVLWREYMPPLIAIEFASGNGDEERDATPLNLSAGLEKGIKPGKFCVYERIIRIPYYVIYEVNYGRLEVYNLMDLSYQKVPPNERGHYPILPLGVELGLWQGSYLNNPEELWLRWWDGEGNLLLIGREEAELQKQRAQEAERKAAQLAERLRAMGIDPDSEE